MFRRIERATELEGRDRLGECLRTAFPVGDDGSFTSLLASIDGQERTKSPKQTTQSD